MRGDGLRIHVQVEHPRDRRGERLGVPAGGAFDAGDDAALARVRADRQRTAVAGPVDDAAVRAILDRFDAGRGASGEETQDARPVERGFERQFKDGEVGGGAQAA